MYIKVGLSSLLIVFLLLFIFKGVHTHMQKPLINVHSTQDVVNLFNHNAESIATTTDYYIKDAQKQLNAIIAVQDRTWKNTAQALDDLAAKSNLSIFIKVLSFLEVTSQDASVRDAASKAVIKINNFFIELMMNPELYTAFKAYADGNAHKETLTATQRYFIAETLKDFERTGLSKPSNVQNSIKELKKKLGELEVRFDKNIAADQSAITVDTSELAGLDDDFIATRKQEDGRIKLGIDYPTFFKVQQQCSNTDVRKKLRATMTNRAYPINKQVLDDIIAVRDEIAHLLGFSSHAAYQLDNEMVQSIDRAEAFLHDVLSRATKKEAQEFKLFTNVLPEGVQLTKDGKFNPWDTAYIIEQYKKKHYNLDQEKIAEYFPMEHTIKGLLAIYEQFLGLRFTQVDIKGLWSDEVRTLAVYDKDTDALLGYVLLDLHPRPFKYSHACAGDVVPATMYDDKPTTEVSVVLANFPKSTDTKPSLLKLSDVLTFFHEFGHAMHYVLGRQELASISGANVKRDFVEMPSQMLEEWLWDKEMLKLASQHYQTGEPLPDNLIDTIIATKNLSKGRFLQGQVSQGMLALNCFKNGADKNVKDLSRHATEMCCPNIAYDPDDNFYASFGHLTGYGARYYGYLWSQVFALDLFNEIKKHGLLDPVIGKRYRELVIGKGGSKDPNELLKDFLGREPNSDAFFKDLGI